MDRERERETREKEKGVSQKSGRAQKKRKKQTKQVVGYIGIASFCLFVSFFYLQTSLLFGHNASFFFFFLVRRMSFFNLEFSPSFSNSIHLGKLICLSIHFLDSPPEKKRQK
jgi:predicted histidine transporter YuiF (NhaC family)